MRFSAPLDNSVDGVGTSAPATRPRPVVRGGRIASPRAIACRVYVPTFAAAAALLPWRHVSVGGDVVDLTFALAAVALVTANLLYLLLLRRNLERHSYGWYAREHAAHVLADGRITCHHCGGRRIVQKGLTGVRFLAQVCGDCKQTLFFRRERRAAGRAGRPASPAVAHGVGQPPRWDGPERRQSPRQGPPS